MMDKFQIIQQHELSGNLIYSALLSGDYKTNNREWQKLHKPFKLFEKDHDLATECINELLKSNNVVVRTHAAAYCLALGINIATGESVLEEIAADPENGIFGFNAKMTLAEWKKKGVLTLYQKRESGKERQGDDSSALID